jgi:hypothetical protein
MTEDAEVSLCELSITAGECIAKLDENEVMSASAKVNAAQAGVARRAKSNFQ